MAGREKGTGWLTQTFVPGKGYSKLHWFLNKGRRSWFTRGLCSCFCTSRCNFPTRVSAILLAHNNLKGALSSYIAVVPSLKELDLSHNLISGEIPSGLMQLSHLGGFTIYHRCAVSPVMLSAYSLIPCSNPAEEINLSSLQLNGSIPSEFGQLSTLRKF